MRVPSRTCCQKKCHLTLKYLVLAVVRCVVASTRAPLLSSNMMHAQWRIVLNPDGVFTIFTANLAIWMIGKATLTAALKAEYSASSVDKDTSVYRYDFQIKGHGPKNMIKTCPGFC